MSIVAELHSLILAAVTNCSKAFSALRMCVGEWTSWTLGLPPPCQPPDFTTLPEVGVGENGTLALMALSRATFTEVATPVVLTEIWLPADRLDAPFVWVPAGASHS